MSESEPRIPDSEFVEPPLPLPAHVHAENARLSTEYRVVGPRWQGTSYQHRSYAEAETDVPAPDDARSVPDPVLCAACGGTGHRNGNRRAADPFGTCPGCDGTGKASRRIIVYDARAGRCGLTVPVGCTVGDAAWLAVAAMGVRVGPDDCPSLAVNGSGLHPANPLPDDLDFELVVIGGTV